MASLPAWVTTSDVFHESHGALEWVHSETALGRA